MYKYIYDYNNKKYKITSKYGLLILKEYLSRLNSNYAQFGKGSDFLFTDSILLEEHIKLFETLKSDYSEKGMSKQLMIEPCIIDSGINVEKKDIEKWFKTSNKCPITGEICSKKLVENKMIRDLTIMIVDLYKNFKSDDDTIQNLIDIFKKKKELHELYKVGYYIRDYEIQEGLQTIIANTLRNLNQNQSYDIDKIFAEINEVLQKNNQDLQRFTKNDFIWIFSELLYFEYLLGNKKEDLINSDNFNNILEKMNDLNSINEISDKIDISNFILNYLDNNNHKGRKLEEENLLGTLLLFHTTENNFKNHLKNIIQERADFFVKNKLHCVLSFFYISKGKERKENIVKNFTETFKHEIQKYLTKNNYNLNEAKEHHTDSMVIPSKTVVRRLLYDGKPIIVGAVNNNIYEYPDNSTKLIKVGVWTGEKPIYDNKKEEEKTSSVFPPQEEEEKDK